MSTTTPKRIVYDIVTERVIELLGKGIVPWRKPLAEAGLPMNVISQRPYRGLNVMLLNCLGYDQNLFITQKQLKEVGGKVKKDEKPHLVTYWKWLESNSPEETDEKVRIPFLRYYLVYNLEQCEGMPVRFGPEIARPSKPILACEQVIEEMPDKPAIKHKDRQAYYNPLIDLVNMPKIDAFESEESYYATFFHQLVHSTGHPKRLNRKRLLEMGEFNPDQYSFEELVAEMGAAYLENHCGIDREFEHNAAYIQSWIAKLQNDNKLIVQASALAQKATDYILHIEREDFVEEKENEEATV